MIYEPETGELYGKWFVNCIPIADAVDLLGLSSALEHDDWIGPGNGHWLVRAPLPGPLRPMLVGQMGDGMRTKLADAISLAPSRPRVVFGDALQTETNAFGVLVTTYANGVDVGVAVNPNYAWFSAELTGVVSWHFVRFGRVSAFAGIDGARAIR